MMNASKMFQIHRSYKFSNEFGAPNSRTGKTPTKEMKEVCMHKVLRVSKVLNLPIVSKVFDLPRVSKVFDLLRASKVLNLLRVSKVINLLSVSKVLDLY